MNKTGKFKKNSSTRLKYYFLLISFLAFLFIIYKIIFSENALIRQNVTIEKNSNLGNSSFVVDDAKLVGNNFINGPFYIDATQIEDKKNRLFFVNPKARILIEQKDWVNSLSNSAYLDENKKILYLRDKIKANINEKYFYMGDACQVNSENFEFKSDVLATFFDEDSRLISSHGFFGNYKQKYSYLNGPIDLLLNQDNKKTYIKSEHLEIIDAEKKIIFIGNVVIEQEQTQIFADKVIFYYDKNHKITNAEAFKGVKIIDHEKTAFSEYGKFDNISKNFTLLENVELHKEQNILKGSQLIYNLTTKKAVLLDSQASGKKGRVSAIIIPKSNN